MNRDKMEVVPSYMAFDLSYPSPVCFLKLNNPTKQHRIFAIRTTNLLEAYTFKPSKGLVKAGESIIFRATLQEDQRLAILDTKEYRCHDEFLVASVPVDQSFVDDYLGLETNDEKRGKIDGRLRARATSKFVFRAIIIPPFKVKSSRKLENESTIARWLRRTRTGTIKSLVLQSASNIDFLGKTDEIREVTFINRSSFYVIVSLTDTSPGCAIFTIEPREGIMIPPKKTMKVKIVLRVATLRGSGKFATTASNVLDPSIVDALLSRPDDVAAFKKFWEQRAPRRRVWTGSVTCVVDPSSKNDTSLLTIRSLLNCCMSRSSGKSVGLLQKQASMLGEELNLVNNEDDIGGSRRASLMSPEDPQDLQLAAV